MNPPPLTESRSGSTEGSRLLMLVSEGDRDAFSRLYDTYSARVYGLALRVLGDRMHAEQVTQEVFLEIWRTAGCFDPAREGALGWMMTHAHRVAVDRIRSIEAASGRDVGAGADITFGESSASADAARVRTSLDVLTPVQRRALELAYFGGHTHAEVAQILHIPLGSAKTRIRNALIHLRESLGPAHA